MSQPLKITSWIVAIVLVLSCDSTFLLITAFTFMEESGSVVAGTIANAFSEIVVPALWVAIPLLQLMSLILGVLVMVRYKNGVLSTTRAIMMLFKLGLIPFFIGGTLIELTFLAMGFHPLLPGMGWIIAFLVGVLGWFTMLSGSIWAIATAVQLRRGGCITGGELAAHIVLQLFFVVDVVDAIVLFSRSKNAEK